MIVHENYIRLYLKILNVCTTLLSIEKARSNGDHTHPEKVS